MWRRFTRAAIVGLLISAAACQRAERYPAAMKPPAKKKSDYVDEVSPRLRWMEPRARREVPIQFVADTSAEWDRLPSFWNAYPPIPLVLGQEPLAALTAAVVTEHIQAIKIKAPRGLPDPTPYLPAGNPPTLGKWRLGQKLFHMPLLRAGTDQFSCASCHQARHAFADGRNQPPGGKRNTLSLINVVYNRRQFWDGRVERLEETIARSLDDERKLDGERSRTLALEQHVFGGFTRALVESKNIRLNIEFDDAFGIEHPTQNAVAQALATYMRTLLSGNSVFDRAESARRREKSPVLSAEHFREALKDEKAADFVAGQGKDRPKRDELPALAMRGHELFHGKARCAQCHAGPLFTDHDFHNVGYPQRPNEDERHPAFGVETGRAIHVPIGFKQTHWIGAFRTPSLRNLGGTAPYFHNGSLGSLESVIEFFNDGIQETPYLAGALKEVDQPIRPRLRQEDVTALAIFLRTLEGTPVDLAVAEK